MKKVFWGLLCIGAMEASAQKWVPTAETAMPEVISNNAVVGAMVAGVPYVYSFAGIGEEKTHESIVSDAWRYNTANQTWESIPALPDDPKVAASASVVKNKIYIVGGYHVAANGSEVSSAKIHRYDPETNSYLSDGTDIPVPIDDQVQCVWKDSLIYVVTGWSQNTNVQDVQIYNPSTDTWAEGTSLPTSHKYRSFGSSGVILNDTIYYFGGARIASNFPIQANLRKGAINPDNPTEIEWSESVLDADIVGYRMAATTDGERIYWIGGSEVTYNFDGIAYNGSGGVEPANRNLVYDPQTGKFTQDFSYNYPMDLRGLADISDSQKYIVGGMDAGQTVSNACLRLDFLSTVGLDEQQDSGLLFWQNNNWHISPQDKPIQWTCYDSHGRVVKQGESYGGPWQASGLGAGVYIVELRLNNQSYFKKIVL